MKRWLLVLPFALLAVFGALAQSVPFATGEWEPFTGAALPNQGIASEIVVAACKAAGMDYKFEFLPWTRAEKTVLDGQSFAAFPYSKNDERLAKYDFSEVLFYTATNIGFYSKGKNLAGVKFSSWADVKPYKVAYLAGSWLEKDMKAAGINLSVVADMDMAVRMLQSGRVDLLIDEAAVLVAAFKRNFPAEADALKIVNTDMFGGRGAVSLMVSRSYPNSRALLDKFNKGLASIKANGTLDGIAAKYGILVK